jgi:GntR family transcriptional regulator / MocR family aminotransferase
MHPVFELDLRLPPSGSRVIRRELHNQLRTAILDGRLAAGLQLPPSRALAEAFGLSRNTVVAIYDLLLGEGYIVARPGAGTYVCARHGSSAATTSARSADGVQLRLHETWRQAPLPSLFPTLDVPPPGRIDFDFRLGAPDTARFPFEIWRRLSTRALRGFERAPDGHRQAAGSLGLRAAIAAHVSFVRAVSCRSEDIIVTSGAQQAFDLLARVLVTGGHTVIAVEDPGYPPLRSVFAAAGAIVKPVPVDGEGLVVAELPEDTSVVYVTPSHQFPLGVPMSPQRRQELLAFASKHNTVIIEDDYDGEFRFAGRPLDALQTLDTEGRVLYIGTFSKSLFPALRLGFVVAPEWARSSLLAARQLSDWHGPIIEQDTLEAFIAEGHLVRHVRRMRKTYDARRTALLKAMARHCRGTLEPIPSAAGLHLTAWLNTARPARTITAQAAQAGVGVEDLSRYAFELPHPPGLVFSYGRIEAARIDAAVALIADVLRDCAAPKSRASR